MRNLQTSLVICSTDLFEDDVIYLTKELSIFCLPIKVSSCGFSSPPSKLDDVWWDFWTFFLQSVILQSIYNNDCKSMVPAKCVCCTLVWSQLRHSLGWLYMSRFTRVGFYYMHLGGHVTFILSFTMRFLTINCPLLLNEDLSVALRSISCFVHMPHCTKKWRLLEN